MNCLSGPRTPATSLQPAFLPLPRLVPPALALIAVTYGLGRFAYGLFLPAIRDDLLLGPTAAGLIGAGAYAGYCVGLGLAVLGTDRLGARRLAVQAGVLATFGIAMIASSTSAALLGVAVTLTGVSTGLASPPLATMVATAVRPAMQARANALINSGTSAGVILAGPIALAASESWRGAYLLFALVSLTVTLWLAGTLPSQPAQTARATSDASPAVSIERRRSALLALVLVALGSGVASAAFWTFGPSLMVTVGGHGLFITTLAWVVLGLAGFAGAAAGDLVARVGLRRSGELSLLGLALATALLAALPGLTAAVLIAAGLFGAAYIALSGVLLIWGVEALPDRPWIGVTLPFLMLAFGQILGTPAAGMLMGALGGRSGMLAFAAVAVVTALADAAARRLRAPRAAG